VQALEHFAKRSLAYNLEKSKVFEGGFFLVLLFKDDLRRQISNALLDLFFLFVRVFFLCVVGVVLVGSVLFVTQSLAVVVVQLLCHSVRVIIVFWQQVSLGVAEVG